MASVGQFQVPLTIVPPDGGETRHVSALVDTGAAYSVLPRSLLESLGCRQLRIQRVLFADGRVEHWPVTELAVECESRRATTTVLMAPPASPILLGAITLEGLGLGVDTLARRLIPLDFVYVA